MSVVPSIRSMLAAVAEQVHRVRIYRRLADHAGLLPASARRKLGIDG